MDGIIQKYENGTLGVAWQALKQRSSMKSANSEVDCNKLWTKFQGNQKLEELHVAAEGSGAVCVLVQGPSGCGKSCLLREYAAICGRTDGETLMVVHLGEQIDSKILLGTFTCTAVPGEFVWLPGLLTKCVLAGHWIVLEDVDSAPSDVISLLLPLVKSRTLNIPGYNEAIPASPGFKLFLTKRISAGGGFGPGHSGILQVLEQHSIKLTLPQLSNDEVQKVVADEFPNLTNFRQQLAGAISEHDIPLRHVLKLCRRISQQVVHGCLTSVPDMMLEVVDCCAGHLSGDEKLARAKELSYLCGGLSEDMVEQLCTSHKPSVQILSTTVSVGRAYLHCSHTAEPSVCYSHTQSSLSLLESVCRCVQMSEPVLLVGETGVGKTATINYLAQVTGNKLVVMNMSQQTDSTDLLGGYKPVQMVHIVAPLKEEFERLFHATFSHKHNARFLASVQTCFTKQQWKRLLKLMLHSMDSAQKRTKYENKNLYVKWKSLGGKLKKLREQIIKSQSFAFAFDKGALMEAVSEGWWILLDEVNLASPETLQCLSGILETHNDAPLLFMEKADSEVVMRHTDFRLFCCMNPSTDVGKKSLPDSIRNRFTEFYVDEPQNATDLSVIIHDYLKNESPSTALVEGVVRLYMCLKRLAKTKLLDGTGKMPHYSLRNLCRALQYAASRCCGSFHRSLYEGFCMSFLTELCQDHHHTVMVEVVRYLALPDAALTCLPPAPSGDCGSVVQVAGFWLACGQETPVNDENYVITPSVRKNLHNLARVVSARKYPVLLQGPTSAGKTSLVQYLARATGHHCLRINNHEHTDLQEYIGMYTPDPHGELVFQEGVLVEAMRKGYWVILDELNLAPTDVLEALNRVLDDNRELFVPETKELVKAHPHFILFGTQNPPGFYGGRKILSRAFRNRFIELHYDDIPAEELVTILQAKCQLPESYAKKMVAVLKDLQVRRTSSGIFAGKYGLITLRDLFRWAERYCRSPTASNEFRDWEQQLAEDGFMLLAGRLREVGDEQVVLDVIHKHFKRRVQPLQLFGQDGGQGSLASHDCLQVLRTTLPEAFSHLVWTAELLRMAVLTYRAISFDEPVLLVGNTGCGKTTLCQFFSTLLGRNLLSINCHMHSEAADFLGGLKPVRNKSSSDRINDEVGLFEWQDGVVVKAMQDGCCLLIDEISLADDAVLERLNSVLERERRLLVSERSRSQGQTEVFQITAAHGFVFMATMNPGGDYGKKELSPALRNRFVEVWCPSTIGDEDLGRIIDHNLKSSLTSGLPWSGKMLRLLHLIKPIISCEFSVRDLLTWTQFMNATSPPLTSAEAFYHGAHLTCLDGLGCGGQMSGVDRENALAAAEGFLKDLLPQSDTCSFPQDHSYNTALNEDLFGIHPFFITKGPFECQQLLTYSLDSPGPHENALRLLRGMQVGKPLLIEGPPGVGKTSLVTALAKASGHHLTRINLSEHTDVSDLFGCDLPVEGGKSVRFAWRDGPLLKALKAGDWVLLDEINLASQSVLEGLNAVLDHRGEVFVPELGLVFTVQPDTMLFACQNPMSQGGGRKGLPKSFLNRFTMVFIDVLSAADLEFISHSLYPDIPLHMLNNMISFNNKVEVLVRKCGATLWEFNLRDVLRWCQLMQDYQASDPGQFVDLLYCRRLRSAFLRAQVIEVYCEVFGEENLPLPYTLGGYFNISDRILQVGCSFLLRQPSVSLRGMDESSLLSLHCQYPILEAIMICVERRWMTLLVGGGMSGKSSVICVLAQLIGRKLVEFPMNSDTDTTELLGGFQQVNTGRHYTNLANRVENVCQELLGCLMHIQGGEKYSAELLAMLNTHLLDSSRILQEYSTDELLLHCEKVKECLLKINDISRALQIPLCYGINEMLLEVSMLVDQVREANSGGQFEWVDSVLVTAVRCGHWLCISNANFCSPSVLDRLNPLMEPGGVLHMDERGVVGDGVVAVTPHSDFRLFLLMDPAHGEISRAMRNRGIEICILPEDTLGTFSKHKEDWRSLISTSGLNNLQAAKFVDSCSMAVDDVSPVKVLQTLHCSNMAQSVTSSQNPLWKYLDVHSVLLSCELSDAWRYTASFPTLLNAMCAQPKLMMALSHFSALLHTFNQHMSNPVVRDASLILRPAMQVYIDHATSFDYEARARLLAELASLRSGDGSVAREVTAVTYALDMYSGNQAQLSIQRGTLTCDLSSLVANTNPSTAYLPYSQLLSITLNSKRTVLAGRLRALQELLHWFSERSNSALRDSHRAHTGQLELESLVHPCLLHIQPLFSNLLHQLFTLLPEYTSTLTDAEKMEEVVEWQSVMLHCFSHPVRCVTELAVLWTLTKSHCLLPLSSSRVLDIDVTNLRPLETIVQHSSFIAGIRDRLELSLYSKEDSDPIARHSELEGVGSATCFKALQSSEESCCTIGGCHSKIDQLQKLLHSLWLSGFSLYSSPIANLQSKLKVVNSILEGTISALSSAVQQSHLTEQFTENQDSKAQHMLSQNTFPGSVFELCGEAAMHTPSCGGEEFWYSLGCEITAAVQEITTVQSSLEAEYDVLLRNRDQRHELELLCGVSQACVHVGVVLSQLLLPTAVDPVFMAHTQYECYQLLADQQCTFTEACNKHYITTTGKTLNDLMSVQYTVPNMLPGARGGVAPYIMSAVKRKKACEELLHSFDPPASHSGDRLKYSNLVLVCNDLVHSLCSPSRVANLQQDAVTANSASLLRIESWSRAVSAAIDKLNSEEYSALVDVVHHFSSGLHLILTGINALSSLQSSILSPEFPLLPVIRDLTQFPFFSNKGSGSAEFVQTILNSLSQITNGIHRPQRQYVHKMMLLVAIRSCHNYISTITASTGGSKRMHASKKWLSLCSSLLEQCWSVWNTSEQLLQAKRAEEDSLYRYRTHKHVIQEEEVEEEVVRQMFPVYDSTFEEGEGDKFETGMGGEAEGLREMEDTEMVCPFTSKEMEEVCDLHLLLFAENTLGDSHRSSGVMSSKYSLAALLADIVSHIPGLMTDYCVIGGHALMCSSLLMELKCKSMGKKSCSNVYKEAVVWEAIRAEPIVSSLKTRVEELLMEWPNHPALVQIVKSCDKVLSLSVTDPLMKILSGLEYILRKAQDWEAYAASHVSLCTQLEALTQLILDWRRMELNSWHSLLASWSTEVQQQSSKWWFHLHSLCQESVSTDHVNIEQLLVSVHQLVEGAPLGEFSERLNILDAFSKDMCIKGHSALVNILKNSELYYQQFLPAVLSQCDKVTAPVEKEFKEHVSIMRWNDGNYWALKASIEKSHRSLIKFMKKWKGVLQTPVRPLLTTCALTAISQSGGEKFHKGIENTHENISRRQISCTDPVLTDDQLRELSCVTVKEFSDSSENQVHLNANAVSQRMSMLLKEFSSSTLYYQWNTTLDELAGEIISTVEQLQSLEFLNGLEGEKRKNAVKLNSSKKRRAIQELLKCLKKQGLSYRKGMDFSRITKCQLFQLPVVQDQFSLGIPEGLQSDIQKYFYCCLGRFAGLQAAFDLPTKDLPASQLKCCKGYAGHMITLLCQQRQTLSSYTHSAHVLQHLLHHVHSLISGELYTIQIAEYSHWQSELVTGAEISLELVSNFAELVATMPDQVDVSSCCDPPPILGCGDQSIAVTALSMLQADLPSLRVLRERLVEKEKEQAYHQYIFVAKSEMLELTEACAVLEHFCETVSKVLDVTLGSGQIRVGMLEFLKAAHSHLSTICQKCRCWVKNAAESVHCTHSTLSANVADGGDDDVTDTTGLLRELLMSVQRVITRHRVCATSTGEYKGDLLDFPCCLHLHLTTTSSLRDMNSEKVIGDVHSILQAVVSNPSEGNMKKILHIFPMLHHYTVLLRMLLINFALAHRTHCKLFSILLALFSDLVAKGVCIPPEVEQVDREGGTEFEEAEGGGFDEGLGTKNVSNEVDADILEDPTENSKETNGTSDKKESEEAEGEAVVDMTQEFGGDLEDLPEEEDDENISEGEEERDFEKEMGELGDNRDQIDKNMWAPEDQQQHDEPRESEEHGGGFAENDDTLIVAEEEHSKHNQSDISQSHQQQPTADEEVLEDREHKGDVDPLPHQEEKNGLDNPVLQQEEMEQDQEDNADTEVDKENLDEEMEEDVTLSEGEDCDQTDGVETGEAEEIEGVETEEAVEVDAVKTREAEEIEGVKTGEAGEIESAVMGQDNVPAAVEDLNDQANSEVGQEGKEIDTTQPSEQEAGKVTSAATVKHSQDEHLLSQKLHPRPCDDYNLASQDERALKRPRLIQDWAERGHNSSSIPNSEHDNMHMKGEDGEHSAVVWDAAPMSHIPGSLPPTDLGNSEEFKEKENNTEHTNERKDSTDTAKDKLDSKAGTRSDIIGPETMDNGTESVENTSPRTEPSSELIPQSFFVSSVLKGSSTVVDEQRLRQSLKEEIKVLHSDKDVDVLKMWQKYEALVSCLSHSLCEELRLVLQPTQAAQLRGDYRTGKRLNMRRIIPYIASYFQNDRIWLRRTKPHKRDYQVLVAVDDSASMNENECSQMAYESLAMISSALTRLECGQLGILRFGEHAELLHSFDQPFSATCGAHVLQHLSFTQPRTNFVEMLQTANLLFSKFLEEKRGTSTSQLLLLLSDGRGVFADGTTQIEVEIRTLNEMGVLTVFVILDSLSKNSVLSIKVPSFASGKVPVIRSYLETFPFPFYIVLQDIKSLPIVLGKALQQWFELLSGPQ